MTDYLKAGEKRQRRELLESEAARWYHGTCIVQEHHLWSQMGNLGL